MSNGDGSFSFLKGAENAIAASTGQQFDWSSAAQKVRENLHEALNARNLSFLLGSGCSSLVRDGIQIGVPTMAPLASEFLTTPHSSTRMDVPSNAERASLLKAFGFDIEASEYLTNLERLMEGLFALKFALKNSSSSKFSVGKKSVDSVIDKVTKHILQKCALLPAEEENSPIVGLYQRFYRKLVFRDRMLPRPWVFTTNYDLMNELALDRLGVPYCNGFSGTVERRFNPTSYRHALAEQLDLSTQRWMAVENFVYLCKLHGSINWVEEGRSLFPIREVPPSVVRRDSRLMIYPTPAKQNASLGSPYSDLFREFHSQVVREQSVLFTVGYSFADEHINNLIFQALSIPTFRLVALVSPDADGVPQKLRELGDPRIWLIGGAGQSAERFAHYFDTFVDSFLPESPGDKVDSAVVKVFQQFLARKDAALEGESSGDR